MGKGGHNSMPSLSLLTKRLLLLAAVAVALTAAYSATSLLQRHGAGPSLAWAAAEPRVNVEAREVTVGAARVADVAINDAVVIKIRRGTADKSAYQVAAVIAGRLSSAVDRGYGPTDIVTGRHEGQWAVLAGNELIAVADAYHASVNNSTPRGLADTWAKNIRRQLLEAGVESRHAPAGPGGGPLPDDAWYEEHYGDKWVPIVSIPDGIRIGAARTNGPKTDLRKVVAVGQFETPWEDFLEIDIYIPLSTRTPGKFLDRVQGVGVTALADFDLTWDDKPSRSKKGWSIFKRPKRKKSHGWWYR